MKKMKKWTTIIMAIDPVDNNMKQWSGPIIKAQSEEAAERYCQMNGLGYCRVYGEFVEEIPHSVAEHATLLSNRDN